MTTPAPKPTPAAGTVVPSPSTSGKTPSPVVPSAYASGPTTNGAASMLDKVRLDNGLYDVAFNESNPEQFAALAGPYFDSLAKSKVYVPAGTKFESDLDYLQAVVRATGKSKGTTPAGFLSLEDYNAIQDVFKMSYLKGVDWATTAQVLLSSPYAGGAGAGGSSFSKEVATSMAVLDATDAESRLSGAYYKAFGVYPKQKDIENFRVKFNKELEAQTAKVTTTGTTNVSAGGTSSTRKQVASSQGFTQEEQDQFLADFLSTNYKITGKEQSGYVKSILTSLQTVYENNLLPAEEMGSMIKFAADLVGTADQTVAQQKIDAKFQNIRNIAAKLNPGVADILASGQNISDILEPVVKSTNATLGTNLTKDDPRFKQILNYNDGKTTRVMTTNEINNFISKQPEFQTSPTAINKYASWGQAIKDSLR